MDEPTIAQHIRAARARDPHDVAALSAARGPSPRVNPGRPRRALWTSAEIAEDTPLAPATVRPLDPTPTPDGSWCPIEFSGPDVYNQRRWWCRNDHGNAQRVVANVTFAGREALRATIRRHMARFHPERDADVEAARVP